MSMKIHADNYYRTGGKMRSMRKLSESVLRGFSKSQFLDASPEASPQVLLDAVVALGREQAKTKNGVFYFQDGVDMAETLGNWSLFWQSYVADMGDDAAKSLEAMYSFSSSMDNELIMIGETLFTLIYQCVRARNFPDVVIAVSSAVGRATNCSALALYGQMFVMLSTYSVVKISDFCNLFREQSVRDFFSETIDPALRHIENMEQHLGKIWSSTFVVYLKAIIEVVIATIISYHEGITVTGKMIEKISRTQQKQSWYFTKDPIEFILRSLLTITRCLVSSIVLGSMDPLFGDDQTLGGWSRKAQLLIELHDHVATLEAHGTNIHEYTKNMSEAIDQGTLLLKAQPNSLEKRIMENKLSQLRMCQNSMLTSEFASKVRDPPFAVLLHGGTSIGKTSLGEILYQYYARIEPSGTLRATPEFKYPRNSKEEHWNNFATTHWAIFFDEIAPFKPGKLNEPDVTTAEVLGVCNSAPYCPPQAALEDKGKTPVKAKLVIATTNVIDLNVTQYFENPSAVMRRFHMIVDVKVKPEYAKGDAGARLLDYSKTDPNAFPDFWTFDLYGVKVVPGSGVQAPRCVQNMRLEKICTLNSMSEFLAYYREKALRQIEECKTMADSTDTISNMELCSYEHDGRVCALPLSLCKHEQPSDHEVNLAHEQCCGGTDIHTRNGGTFQLQTGTEFAAYERALTSIPAAGLSWFQRIRLALLKYLVGKPAFVRACINNLPPEVLEKLVRSLDWGTVHTLLGNIGRATCSTMAKSSLVKKLLGGTALILSLLIPFIVWLRHKKSVVTSSTPGDCIVAEEHFIGKPMAGEESSSDESYSGDQPAVWYKSDYRTTPFDVGRASLSWVGSSQEFIVRQLEKSIARFVFKEPNARAFNNALALGDALWVTNAHFLKRRKLDEPFTMDILFGSSNGVSESILDIPIFPSMIEYDWENDLAFLWIPSLPPRKNILELLPKQTLRGVHEGFILRREKPMRALDGGYSSCAIEKPSTFYGGRFQQVRVMNTDRCLEAFLVNTEIVSEEGQCGGVAISMGASGPIILGIHSLGHGTKVAFVPIWRERALEAFAKRTKFVANAGGLPLNEDCPDIIPELHKKDPLRFIPSGSAEAYGTIVGFRSHPKSFVINTPLYKPLAQRGWKCHYGVPAMRGWGPKHNALKDILDARCWIDPGKLDVCADAFTRDILSRLPDDWAQVLGVVDMDTAINGVPGIAHLERINISTSCGFPYRGTKKKFLVDENGRHEGRLILDEKIVGAVDEALATYKSGCRYNPIFTAALKDEPRKFEKIKKELTRMFQVSPFVFSIVFRMYYMKLLRIFYTSHEAFEAAPGVAANSGEWDQLAQELERYGSRLIDGDFGKFDTALKAPILRAVIRVLLHLAEQSGQYSEEDLMVMYLLGLDAIYVHLEFFGSLFQLYGMNSSGNPATVVFNCLGHSLLMRFVYLENNPDEEVESFCSNIMLVTYGDDGVMRVHPDCWWMSYSIIRDTLASVEITYTSADKSFEGPDYKPLSEISFLKRSFRFDEEIGHYMGALDFISIQKMVMKCVRSKTIPLNEQAIAEVGSAVQDLFLHGRAVFEQRVPELKAAVEEAGLSKYVQPYTFPTWEELLYSYAERSYKRDYFKGSLQPGRFKRPVKGQGGEILELETILNQNASVLSSNCIDPGLGLVRMDLELDAPGQPPKSLFREGLGSSPLGPNHAEEIGLSSDVLNKRSANTLEDIIELEFQSGTIENPLPQQEKVKEETVQFASAVAGEKDGFSAYPEAPAPMQDVTLAKFLSRPVQILYSLWVPGDPVGPYKLVLPWYEFINNAYIKPKLQNYAFIRGNLKVKILVNATPFVYGAALASYFPLSGYNMENAVSGANTNYIIPRSQRPHVWIFPSNSAGGELTLPFFYFRDWLELSSAAAIKAMGALYIDIVTPLASATASANVDCSIQVYAWMEDVELSGPTIGLALQSGVEENPQDSFQFQSGKDEYVGIISQPASAVAAAAGKLSKEPVIGKLMTATQVGASAVAKISSLFGFSNKIDISGQHSVQAAAYPHLASVGTSHPVSKLSLDPKNELGISPKLVGLPEDDELSIKHIVTRESFVNYFGWDPTQVTDTLLFAGRVTPRVYSSENTAVAGSTVVNQVPMSWVSKLFRYWRGSIIYRFKFVCTPYHKGRVYITYDPYGTGTANLVATADTSAVAQTYVVDLSTNTDFEIRVPYCQASPWCALESSQSTANIWANFSSPVYNYKEGYDNGMISMRVQTELSAPNGSSAVSVLVFVRGGDDLEFAGPGIDTTDPVSYFAPQSGVETLSETDAPEAKYLINMGEKITTLRSLIQRRAKCYTRCLIQGQGGEVSGIAFGRTPIQFGYDPSGWSTLKAQDDTTSVAGNHSTMTPLTYLWPGFVGVKGALEYVFNVDSVTARYGTLRAYRKHTTSVPGKIQASTANTNADFVENWLDIYADPGNGGMAIANQIIQPGQVVSFPYYNANKFQPTEIRLGCNNIVPNAQWSTSVGVTLNTTNRNLFREFDVLCMDVIKPLGAATMYTTLTFYLSAGTDFSLLWFLSVPTIYIYGHRPLA